MLADRVAHAVGRWHAGNAQVTHVARERGLCDGPSALEHQPAQFFLAADDARGDELENDVLSFAF